MRRFIESRWFNLLVAVSVWGALLFVLHSVNAQSHGPGGFTWGAAWSWVQNRVVVDYGYQEGYEGPQLGRVFVGLEAVTFEGAKFRSKREVEAASGDPVIFLGGPDDLLYCAIVVKVTVQLEGYEANEVLLERPYTYPPTNASRCEGVEARPEPTLKAPAEEGE